MHKSYFSSIDNITIETKDVGENTSENLSLNKVYVIKGTANSGLKDRASDVMPKSCWDLENFKKNPILLYSHDYESPLGKITELYATESGLKFVAEIGHIDSDMTEVQSNAVKLLKQGILKTFSVGFIGHDYDYDKQNEVFIYKKAELLEISLVAIPMDANATLEGFYQKQLNMKGNIAMIEEVKQEVLAIKEEIKKFSSLVAENEQIKKDLEAKNSYIKELEEVLAQTQELI